MLTYESELLSRSRAMEHVSDALGCDTATKRYIAENFISKHEKPTLLQQLPIFVAAGTAAERKLLLECL